ncbi:hypothetical protein [Ferrimonas marina]|uniref:SatD family (SatD) n=1 Tax=Ferrimonas marina TaxID=299255 RepID=A0A1M5TRK8_9GAMM|nr:hypothetical protein [Ferrimonas marina]SHH53339.1 hypothetical protein SAMN02745129_2249 [Ferrimonas marina]
MAISAVITGDVVRSQSLSPEDSGTVLSTLKRVIAHCQERYNTFGELSRGDSFQLHCPNPRDGLVISVLFRLALRSLKTQNGQSDARLALAVGEGAALDETVGSSQGAVFVLSGRALDAMDAERLAFACSSPDLEEIFSVTLSHLDLLISNLKTKAAKVMLERLMHPNLTHEELGKNLDLSRSGVSQALRRADAHLIDATLALYQRQLMNPIFWAGTPAGEATDE